MSIYLVTGAAGFIGSAITSSLVARGHTVRALDNFSMGSPHHLADIAHKIDFTEGDIRDQSLLERLCEGVDVIIHQASVESVQSCIEDPMGTYEVNVGGICKLIEAARTAGVRRIVFASTSGVYGDAGLTPVHELSRFGPLSPCAAQKLQCEVLLQAAHTQNQLETVSLRYFDVYGPGQTPELESAIIARFLKRMTDPSLSGPITIFGDGSNAHDFVFIEDVVAATLAAAEADAEAVSGKSFNIGSSIASTVIDAAADIANLLGYHGGFNHEEGRTNETPNAIADIALAAASFGYQPRTSLIDGLKQTIHWMSQDTDAAPSETKELSRAGAPLRLPTGRRVASQTITNAIERDEFTLAYQPIVELPSGRAIGVEALLRHKTEEQGRAPLRLIRLAEATGAIVDLGAWVLEAACHDGRRLQAALGPDLRISVNVSMPQLEDLDFMNIVEKALSRSGLRPQTLELEITERVLISQRKFARHTLRNLQEIGVGVALDDFGCGCANLQHLRHLHVDRLKTDRSILRSSTKSWPIFDGVVAFAKQLHLPLVAEGIETKAQLEQVLRAECREAQGYLFSKPVWIDDLLASTLPQYEVA